MTFMCRVVALVLPLSRFLHQTFCIRKWRQVRSSYLCVFLYYEDMRLFSWFCDPTQNFIWQDYCFFSYSVFFSLSGYSRQPVSYLHNMFSLFHRLRKISTEGRFLYYFSCEPFLEGTFRSTKKLYTTMEMLL